MARIRTIKPEFFRDEDLQDLEAAHSGCHVMLVFAGLWGHCDRNGAFEWRPRQLKLDILPFLPFSMDQALGLLEGAGFIRRYTVDGKEYGLVPSFAKHQRLNGKEAQEPCRYPVPQEGSFMEVSGKQRGSNGEASETTGREGKGMDIYAVSDSPNPSSQKVEWGLEGFSIPESVKTGFKTAYPAADVDGEIAKAHAWVLANPKNRKSNWGRFLNSWLQRAQDRAPAVGGARQDVFAGVV